MVVVSSLVAIVSILSSGFAATIPEAAAAQAMPTTVYQFGNGMWVENIAVRPNGNLVLVLYDRPEVYELNPFTKTPKLLHRFPNATSMTGCVETNPDTFAVMAKTKQGFSIWTLGLSSSAPVIEQVIPNVPDAGALNGLAALSPTILLASDTTKGVIFRLDLAKRTSSVAINKDQIGFGVNGIRVRGNYLYFANSIGPFSKIPIDATTGAATGAAKVIAKPGIGMDDFALGRGDEAFVMNWTGGKVLRIDGAGKVTTVAKTSWPTSGQFGRTKADEGTLYVTSSGNPLGSIASSFFAGGSVVSLTV
jgi:hypothetical protein